MMKRTISVAAFATLSAPFLVCAQTFSNSSFETPSVATYLITPTGASWTFSGRAFIQHNGSAFGADTAPNGVQTAALQGLSNLGTGYIQQAATFTTSGYYVVSFSAAQRYPYGPQIIQFSQNGSALGLIRPNGTKFLSYTSPVFFAAGGGASSTFKFASTDITDDRTAFMDAVSIRALGPPANQNLSFETPDLSVAGPGGAPVSWAMDLDAGWTFSGRGGIQRNGSAFSGGQLAPAGVQTAFLQGHNSQPTAPGAMEQTFTLNAGQYRLSLKAAQRSGFQPQSFTVSYSPISAENWVDALVITPSSSSFLTYDIPLGPVLATANTRIRVRANDTSGDKTAFIDDVSLTPVRSSPLLYGYFGTCDHADASAGPSCIAETARHVNFVFETASFYDDWQHVTAINTKVAADLADAKARGIQRAMILVDYAVYDATGPFHNENPYTPKSLASIQANLRDLFNKLIASNVLSMVVALYPADEPETHGLTASNIQTVNQSIRSVMAEYPNLGGTNLAVIYGSSSSLLGSDYYDWLGFDEYSEGDAYLNNGEYDTFKIGLLPNQRIILVPGGGGDISPLVDPTNFLAKADSDSQVIAIVPFIWFDHSGGSSASGIRSNYLAASYCTAGATIKGVSSAPCPN